MMYSCFRVAARFYHYCKKSFNDWAASFLSHAEVVYENDERIVYKLKYIYNNTEYTHLWSKEFKDDPSDMLEEEDDGHQISAAIFKCESELIDAYPVFKYIRGPLCPLEIKPMEILQFLIDRKYLKGSNYLLQDWIKYGVLTVYYKNMKRKDFKMTESLQLI